MSVFVISNLFIFTGTEMTTGEYVQLREVFLQGGMVERINHATSMGERQFREFVQRLDLPYSASHACGTWQMLAREGARRLEDLAVSDLKPMEEAVS